MFEITELDIIEKFTNHPPVNAEVAHKLDVLTQEFIGLGQLLRISLEDSPEKSTAITKLRECSMWAKAAVALYQNGPWEKGPLTKMDADKQQ